MKRIRVITVLIIILVFLFGCLGMGSGKYEIDDSKCVGCVRCISVCPEDAISMNGKTAVIDTQQCIGCGRCVPVCRFDAMQKIKGE